MENTPFPDLPFLEREKKPRETGCALPSWSKNGVLFFLPGTPGIERYPTSVSMVTTILLKTFERTSGES